MDVVLDAMDVLLDAMDVPFDDTDVLFDTTDGGAFSTLSFFLLFTHLLSRKK